jgi:serine/threonine-protein kinase
VDARSDVYAAGCVLFELLCGQPPFVGDSPVSVAYQHVREEPRAPSALNPEVTPDVDAVVLKALAKNPANRYQSAAEMRADLLRAAAGRPVLATPVMSDAETALLGQQGEPARVGDPDRRRASTWVLIALGVLGALAVIALIVGLVLTNQSTPQAAVPDVLGLSPEEAVEEITGAGLQAALGDPVIGDCEQDEGQVERQAPAGGDEVDENSTVTYQVCGGPGEVTIPEGLVGSTEESATERLEGLGLVVVPEQREDSRDAGEVVEVSPPAGTPVEVGSDVTIFVSTGNILAVPDVVGERREIAIDRLEQAGFDVNEESADNPPEDPDDVGRVASQSPEGGSDQPRGSTVTIVVFPDGPELEVSEADVNGLTVTITWDNGIDGGVTIDWGDGSEPDTFNSAADSASHDYQLEVGETEADFTITVTDSDDGGRSASRDVTVTAGP